MTSILKNIIHVCTVLRNIVRIFLALIFWHKVIVHNQLWIVFSFYPILVPPSNVLLTDG